MTNARAAARPKDSQIEHQKTVGSPGVPRQLGFRDAVAWGSPCCRVSTSCKPLPATGLRPPPSHPQRRMTDEGQYDQSDDFPLRRLESADAIGRLGLEGEKSVVAEKLAAVFTTRMLRAETLISWSPSSYQCRTFHLHSFD